jgi:hypothetical protein
VSMITGTSDNKQIIILLIYLPKSGEQFRYSRFLFVEQVVIINVM